MAAIAQDESIMGPNEVSEPPKLPPGWFVHEPGAFMSSLQAQRRSLPVDDGEQTWLGRVAPHHRRAEIGARARCHRRVSGRWPESRPAGDERLGRRPPRMVAKPQGAPARGRSTVRREPSRGARVRVAGEERERLWKRWGAVNPDLDGFSRSRSTETPVIVLEPRAEMSSAKGVAHLVRGSKEP